MWACGDLISIEANTDTGRVCFSQNKKNLGVAGTNTFVITRPVYYFVSTINDGDEIEIVD